MLKNKKLMMVLAIVVVGTLFGGILAVSVASDWNLGQEATPASGASFYESAYAKATSEQKEELDKIIADKDQTIADNAKTIADNAKIIADKDQTIANQAKELAELRKILSKGRS